MSATATSLCGWLRGHSIPACLGIQDRGKLEVVGQQPAVARTFRAGFASCIMHGGQAYVTIYHIASPADVVRQQLRETCS